MKAGDWVFHSEEGMKVERGIFYHVKSVSGDELTLFENYIKHGEIRSLGYCFRGQVKMFTVCELPKELKDINKMRVIRD
jgi:hypothetical protein